MTAGGNGNNRQGWERNGNDTWLNLEVWDENEQSGTGGTEIEKDIPAHIYWTGHAFLTLSIII